MVCATLQNLTVISAVITGEKLPYYQDIVQAFIKAASFNKYRTN